MSRRIIISLATTVLMGVVIYFARDSILEAFGLIKAINFWIFILILPTQIISFAAIGQVMISYLKRKGEDFKMSWPNRVRLALEMNFVDQIVPVPSLAGMTYFTWVMRRYGVSASRSMMAYIVRVISAFCCFAIAVLISVVALSFDYKINRTMLNLSAVMVILVFIILVALVIIANNAKRLVKFSVAFSGIINKIFYRLTFKKKPEIISCEKVERFLLGLHKDYIEIKHDKKILIKPFLWAGLDCVFDVLLIFIAFWSLGTIVNPAILFIVYGVCSMVGLIVATPGGVGAVEALMITLYASTGMPASEAIAGTVLARVTLFSGTIIFGYLFYQMTIHKYGEVASSDISSK